MNALKILAFGLWAALALAPDVLARSHGLDGAAAIAIYLALLAWACAGMLVAGFVANGAIRWTGAVLFAGGALVATGFAQGTGEFLTYDAFINLINATGFASQALDQFAGALAWSAGLSAVLLLAIGLPPRGRLALPAIAALFPLLVLGSIAAMLFVRGGDGARGLPASYSTLAYLGLYAGETAMAPRAQRDASKLALSGQPSGHIVLVVDESISGNYLDINSPDGVATPLSRRWPGLAITNYGIVPSITNCSFGTNVALRYGGTRANYRETVAGGASIWAYAKRAGMRTVYIDAQRTDGALHNGMDERETGLIDSVVQFDSTPVLGRDHAAADRLARELASARPTFILVNKVGAHFPVHDKFPDDQIRYSPILPRGGFAGVSDTGSREGFDGTGESWRRYRNSYRNAIGWNVGGFFDRLLEQADLSATTLIYTADHGQDLHDDGRSGLSTHCSSEPHHMEGAVPLVVIAGEQGPGARFTAGGNGSHYRIFPTLLNLMTYDRASVRAAYGPDLFDPAPEPDTFNARFNARLGREPVWVSIEAGRLANPVRLDQSPGRIAAGGL